MRRYQARVRFDAWVAGCTKAVALSSQQKAAGLHTQKVAGLGTQKVAGLDTQSHKICTHKKLQDCTHKKSQDWSHKKSHGRTKKFRDHAHKESQDVAQKVVCVRDRCNLFLVRAINYRGVTGSMRAHAQPSTMRLVFPMRSYRVNAISIQ